MGLLSGAMAQTKGAAGRESIGIRISNLLEDARAKGLLQTEQDLSTQGAIQQAVATNPLKQSNMIAQAAEQGNQTRLTNAAKRTAEDLDVSNAGPQPEGGFFKDNETGKTGIHNYTYDDTTGQWVKKTSPASFNLIESMMGGGGGGDPIEAKLQQILDGLFATNAQE